MAKLLRAVDVAHRLLRRNGVHDVARGVDELLLGVLDAGDVLLADVDEVLPGRPARRDLVPVGREPGLGEQVAAVAHRLAADVGPEPDLGLAVRGERLLPLPRQVLGRVVGGARQAEQVDELVGLVAELDDEALVDGGDIGGARAGHEVLLQVLVLLVVVAGVQHDLDVRVVLLVQRHEGFQPEVTPEVDLQGDRGLAVGGSVLGSCCRRRSQSGRRRPGQRQAGPSGNESTSSQASAGGGCLASWKRFHGVGTPRVDPPGRACQQAARSR